MLAKFKNTLNTALVFSVVLIASKLMISYYVIDLAHSIFIISVGASLIKFIFPLILLFVIIGDYRKSVGETWLFKDAFIDVFIILIVSSIVSYVVIKFIFTPFLYPDLDKDFNQAMSDAINNYIQHLQNQQTATSLQQDLNELNKPMSLGSTIWFLTKFMLYFSVISFFLALIYKKKKFISPDEQLLSIESNQF